LRRIIIKIPENFQNEKILTANIGNNVTMYQLNNVPIFSVWMIDTLLQEKYDKNLFFTNCGLSKNHYICTKKKFSNGKPN